MRLLVIGGLHGDEPLGKTILAELDRCRDPNITTLLGNPAACAAETRYIEADLNRVFPGDLLDGRYEVKRAYELREWLDDDRFDLILDFHNTAASDNDCGFVGDQGDRTMVAAASAFLGLPRIVIANYDCVNRYASNCLSVEVSLDSSSCRADLWVARIRRLAAMEASDLNSLILPPVFQFVDRITPEQIDKMPTDEWRAFVPIPEADARSLGLPVGSQAIFIDDQCRHGYFAAVVVPAGLEIENHTHTARAAIS